MSARRRWRSWWRGWPGCKTLVWNGPLGAFETPPFDAATVALAQAVAATHRGRRAAQRGRRRRHRLGAAPCRGAGADELCLDRRRRVPGVDGRQDPAGGGGAGGLMPAGRPRFDPRRWRSPDVNRGRGRVPGMISLGSLSAFSASGATLPVGARRPPARPARRSVCGRRRPARARRRSRCPGRRGQPGQAAAARLAAEPSGLTGFRSDGLQV